MRATPSFRRLASTIARPASSCVMCAASTRAPSAMPTRSAPSSRALALISAAVSGLRNISTAFLLPAFELLELARDDAFIAVGADPAHVPVRQPRNRLAGFARFAPALLDRFLLRRALRDFLLQVGEMRVVVVADR